MGLTTKKACGGGPKRAQCVNMRTEGGSTMGDQSNLPAARLNVAPTPSMVGYFFVLQQ